MILILSPSEELVIIYRSKFGVVIREKGVSLGELLFICVSSFSEEPNVIAFGSEEVVIVVVAGSPLND